MKGLWSEHFKLTTTALDTSPTDSDQPPAPPQYQRCLPCPKCTATLRLRTSNTPRNPGRQFYTCPSHDHEFFKWADKVTPDQFIDVPNCGGCSAGLCRVRRETLGPNAGRILFMCRVKEGEGSCGYRVWQDELESSETGQEDERISSSQSTINFDDISATNIDLAEESKKVDIVMPINSSEHPRCREIISPKTGQSKWKEDKPSVSSRRPCKRKRYGDIKASGSLISTHSLKVCLPANNVPIKYSWIEDAKRQNLSSQLLGWWGRLAFHPMPCLMTYISDPFTYYISLPLDSAFVIQDGILVNKNIESTTLSRSRGGVKSYSKPPFNLKECCNKSVAVSCRRNLLEAERDSKPLFSPCHQNTEIFQAALDVPSLSQAKIQNFISESISHAFFEAAQHLQNDLITLLETMDAKDHVAMRQAAETTFAALGHLLFDHQVFKNCVNELIQCASSLSQIEQSMPTNDSYQRLVERCSSERTRLEEIICFHAETTDSVTKKKKRLNDLKEEISSTREWLSQIEAEICCFEAKMKNMELELEEISRNKEELEGQYLIAFNELEESKKLFEWKEAELNAAKAVYDRARAVLRGRSLTK